MRLILLLLSILATSLVSAQTLTGRVTAADTGEPLPYASIFVQETGGGTVTNASGDYQLQLPRAGQFTLVFQYLGYATEVKQRRISGRQSLDVELNQETFDLETIEVVDGGEDASYTVIRRAIAKADYHLNQVDAYTARAYIKGGGRVKKVPGLIKGMMSKEERAELDTNRVFTSESVSNISYRRPNTFRQDVISTYEVGDVPVDATPYLLASFYEPKVAESISPLSPRAFAYYRFEHQGMFNDRGRNVNRIKVTPRSRGEDVFSGSINIVQDSWAIHSLELETYKFGFRFVVNQTYAPVEAKVWMPISTTVGVTGGIMGIKIEGNYLSTVSDYEVELNPDLPAYVEVIDEKTDPQAAKATERENRTRDYETRLAEGGELTRRELRRLTREYKRREKAESEEPEVVSNYTFNQDSSKGVSDTAFWRTVRPVPLTEREVRSYAIEDSLARLPNVDTLDESGAALSLSVNSDGDSEVDISRQGRRFRFSPDFDFFNAVEGYALGLRVSKSFKLGENKGLRLMVNPRYGLAWKRGTYRAGLTYQSKKEDASNRIKVEGGRFLRQYDASPAINPILGTFALLLNRENYLSFYERAYGRVRIERELNPGLGYSASFGYEDRRRVRNNSNQGWLNTNEGDYEANEPLVRERPEILSPLAPAAVVRAGIRWRPGLKYAIRNGNREPLLNDAPLLRLDYRIGLSGIGDSEADFQEVRASVAHDVALGVRGKLSFLVRGGTFLRRSFVQLPDYRHFATTEIALTTADPIGSYRLLPYYEYSTQREYAEVYAHYQFRKFLLSRIWQLQMAGIREDIFVNYLYTPESEQYVELGYTIDNILRVFRVEFVTSWQDFSYQDFGIRISAASVFGRSGRGE